jgi:hypothetical protein
MPFEAGPAFAWGLRRGRQGAIEEDERGLTLGRAAVHRAALRTMLLHCAVTYRAS